MRFFIWYYTTSLKNALVIWENLTLFLVDHFSIADLIKTLLAPWHRDVIRRSWRGLHPMLFLKTHAENLLSRFLGGIVRIFVILSFLVLFVGLQLFSIAVLFLWIFAHAILVFWLGMLMVNWELVIFLYFLLSIVWTLVGFVLFFRQKMRPYSMMSLKELHKCGWFDRVLARVGIQKNEIDVSAFYDQSAFVALLKEKNISQDDYLEALSWEMQEQIAREERGQFWTKKYLRNIPPIARQWKYAYTIHVDRYAHDMVTASRFRMNKQAICAHTQELEKLLITLQRPSQNCVMLVGEPGVGKNSLVEFFADQIRRRKVPRVFYDTRLMYLEIDRVLVQHRGDLRSVMNYLELLFEEVAYAGNIVLYIKDIHNYLGTQARANELPDISVLLNKYLPLPDFRMISSTTLRQYHTSVERTPIFKKFFEIVEFSSVEDVVATRVLLDEFSSLEKKRVFFTFKSFRRIVDYSNRFNASVPLPERAIDLAKEVLLHWKDHSQNLVIQVEDVEKFISIKTGVPLGEIKASEQEKLLHLEEILSQRVVGQKEAVVQIARALRKARSGIQNQQKPIGSFLFLGPTGVGKTELAKVLAKAYFGDEAHMVRLDMSEYQSPNSIERLLGSRQLDMNGKLASEISDHPYGVLLLDELEKAHSGVLDIFLQVLDEGYVTDAFDQKILFNNLIIIATTNAGANIIKDYFQEGQRDVNVIKEKVIEHITQQQIYRVEFLNRFDGIIFFNLLSSNEIIEVTQILLEEVGALVEREKHINVVIENGVADAIAQKGYNEMFGARSIKRFIANNVESFIASSIIERGVNEGETLTIGINDLDRML